MLSFLGAAAVAAVVSKDDVRKVHSCVKPIAQKCNVDMGASDGSWGCGGPIVAPRCLAMMECATKELGSCVRGVPKSSYDHLSIAEPYECIHTFVKQCETSPIERNWCSDDVADWTDDKETEDQAQRCMEQNRCFAEAVANCTNVRIIPEQVAPVTPEEVAALKKKNEALVDCLTEHGVRDLRTMCPFDNHYFRGSDCIDKFIAYHGTYQICLKQSGFVDPQKEVEYLNMDEETKQNIGTAMEKARTKGINGTATLQRCLTEEGVAPANIREQAVCDGLSTEQCLRLVRCVLHGVNAAAGAAVVPVHAMPLEGLNGKVDCGRRFGELCPENLTEEQRWVCASHAVLTCATNEKRSEAVKAATMRAGDCTVAAAASLGLLDGLGNVNHAGHFPCLDSLAVSPDECYDLANNWAMSQGLCLADYQHAVTNALQFTPETDPPAPTPAPQPETNTAVVVLGFAAFAVVLAVGVFAVSKLRSATKAKATTPYEDLRHVQDDASEFDETMGAASDEEQQ